MNCLRTTLLLAALTALFMGIGYLFGGASGALPALLLATGVNFLAYWNADNLVLMMHGAQEVDAGDRTRSMRACAPPSISCWIAHAARLPHGQSSAKRVRDPVAIQTTQPLQRRLGSGRISKAEVGATRVPARRIETSRLVMISTLAAPPGLGWAVHARMMTDARSVII